MTGVFFRTFGQLFAPYVLVAVTAAQVGDYNLTRTQIFVGLVMATVGGVVAVLMAIQWGAETDRLRKSLRSAAQSAIAVLGAVVVNSVADIFILPRVLVPGLISIAGAFVYTFLTNTDEPPVDEVPIAPV